MPAQSSAEKTVTLPVTPDEAFALITEPERLRRWKAISARVDLRAGGEYRFTITPGNVAAGTYREIEPGRRIVFGWGWEGSDDLPPDASTVTVTLEPVDGGTLVRLVHEGLTEEQAVSHGQGWTHFFERLAEVAGTGDAGPDEWSAVPGRMTPLSGAEAALAVAQTLLRDLTDEQLLLPTPCPQFTVGTLADHLTTSMLRFASMTGQPVAAAVEGSPEGRVAEAARVAIEAWTERGTEGTVRVGGGERPAAVAVAILPVELLIHAWDLARATDRPLPIAGPVVDYVLALAVDVITPADRERGAFAPPVAVDPGADALTHLIAYSGRAAA